MKINKNGVFGDSYRISKNVYKMAMRNTASMIGKKFYFDDRCYYIEINGYKSVFGGYYDKQIFKPDNSGLVLVNAVNMPSWIKPNPRVRLDLFVVDHRNPRNYTRKIGETYSWNWQQGCRAHWIDNNEVIYNCYDIEKKKYYSKILDLKKNNEKIIGLPVQDSDIKKNIYCLGYEALSIIRPDYGYRNVKANKKHLEYNNIGRYILNEDKYEILVEVKDLVEYLLKCGENSVNKYKVNHVLVNRVGDKLVFLFRYFDERDKRKTDLFVYSNRGGIYSRVLRDCNVSHYCWMDDVCLLFTGNINDRFGYYIINMESMDIKKIGSFGDGHPVFLNDKEIISDTYPDKFGVRELYLMKVRYGKAEKEVLVRRVEPFLFQGETRCDMHPMVSEDKKYIKFDTAKGLNRIVGIYGRE